MSDQFLLFWPMTDGSDDFILLSDEEALIEKVEAFTRTGTPVRACRLVPVELDVKVKARLIKRRSKNSTAADLREAVPPVPSREAAVEVVPKDSHREAEPGDQVAGADVSQLTEGPAHAPEQDREACVELRPAGSVLPAEGATASPDAATEGTVCAVCDDPALPGKPFCTSHYIGGVKPEVVEKLRKSKGQLRAAAPLVPHD